ncbi:putative diacylglycerol O-acyltransferase tgs1 [Malassezia sp. CBS 17886]|nr:putative diacylglycerol O-acyltransferase tgs1 [Malassezia sp. CBS 17886]
MAARPHDSDVDMDDMQQALALAVRRRDDMPANMFKYWRARNALFSRFSEGILLDEESWFSVTPEAIAYRIATQCSCAVALDGFCGAGGNVIQLAITCGHAVGIDIDPVKLAMARHNARIYGVEDKITFLLGDFCEFARDSARGDAAGEAAERRWQGWHRRDVDLYSPPWGGVDYQDPANMQERPADTALPKTPPRMSPETKQGDACRTDCQRTMYTDLYPLSELRPCGGKKLVKLARLVSPRTVLYLPRNVDLDDVAHLAIVPGTQTCVPVHVEELWMGLKLKALAVYINIATAPGRAVMAAE